jgi:hypothetical protein
MIVSEITLPQLRCRFTSLLTTQVKLFGSLQNCVMNVPITEPIILDISPSNAIPMYRTYGPVKKAIYAKCVHSLIKFHLPLAARSLHNTTVRVCISKSAFRWLVSCRKTGYEIPAVVWSQRNSEERAAPNEAEHNSIACLADAHSGRQPCNEKLCSACRET